MNAQLFLRKKREFLGQNVLKHQSKDAFKVRETIEHVGYYLKIPKSNVDSNLVMVPDGTC